MNAGFGNEKLLAQAEEGQSWIYKNKEHGMLSATASMGLSYLWSWEPALNALDKFTYNEDDYVKVCFKTSKDFE